MRLRGYYLRGSTNELSDMHLEFKDEESSPLNIAVIYGKNGSGKSYILSSIARAWSSSVLTGGSTDLPYIADLLRIDYEHGNEICSVHVRRGHMEKSSTLAKASDLSVGDNPYIKNGIVYYSGDRCSVSRSTVRGGVMLEESVASVFPIIYDLHMRDIQNSVILVDDWDRGLDTESSKNMYSHLCRHALSKGNQLILSSSSIPAEYIPIRSVLTLNGRTDPIQRSMGLLSEAQEGNDSARKLQ